MQLREFDLALADLVLCLQIEPADSAVVKLKAQVRCVSCHDSLTGGMFGYI